MNEVPIGTEMIVKSSGAKVKLVEIQTTPQAMLAPKVLAPLVIPLAAELMDEETIPIHLCQETEVLGNSASTEPRAHFQLALMNW